MKLTNLALLSLILVLASCSAAVQPGLNSTAEPPIGAVPQLLASETLHLPAQDYLTSTEQRNRLAGAELALVRKCMARFGISYSVQPASSTNYGPISLTDRRYGITDRKLAHAYGYGLGARDPARMQRPARPAIGPQGQTALSGQGASIVNGQPVPAGGCIGEADSTLSAGIPETTDIHSVDRLLLDSFQRSHNDPRVRAALQAWSDCMARSGHHYIDPLAAAADPRFISSLDAYQISVASTDIDCKVEANVVGVWFTVEAAYQRQAIDTDPATYDAVRNAIALRDQAAVKVLQ